MNILRVIVVCFFLLIVSSCGNNDMSSDNSICHKKEIEKYEPRRATPAQALEMLREGNQRFFMDIPEYPHQKKSRRELSGLKNQGDYAYATVLSCSDSRLPVELIFDSGIMDIFVVRVAGNVCDTDEIGSIEYGLSHVHTPVLVILGHTQCGAVTAVTHDIHGESHKLERNIPPLIDNIYPAVEKAIHDNPEIKGDSIIPKAIEENVWQAISDLFFQSPTTRGLVTTGKVKVVGAIYDVSTGEVNWLPEARIKEILDAVEKNPTRK